MKTEEELRDGIKVLVEALNEAGAAYQLCVMLNETATYVWRGSPEIILGLCETVKMQLGWAMQKSSEDKP